MSAKETLLNTLKPHTSIPPPDFLKESGGCLIVQWNLNHIQLSAELLSSDPHWCHISWTIGKYESRIHGTDLSFLIGLLLQGTKKDDKRTC